MWLVMLQSPRQLCYVLNLMGDR